MLGEGEWEGYGVVGLPQTLVSVCERNSAQAQYGGGIIRREYSSIAAVLARPLSVLNSKLSRAGFQLGQPRIAKGKPEGFPPPLLALVGGQPRQFAQLEVQAGDRVGVGNPHTEREFLRQQLCQPAQEATVLPPHEEVERTDNLVHVHLHRSIHGIVVLP